MHELKVDPIPFRRMFECEKTFEVRKNDRDFQVNDVLYLREYNRELNDYSGRTMFRRVTYVLEGGQYGIEKGYCVMSIIQ